MAFLVFAGFSTSLLYSKWPPPLPQLKKARESHRSFICVLPLGLLGRRPQPGFSWAPAFNRPRWRANDSGMELRFAFLNVLGLFWIQVLVHR